MSIKDISDTVTPCETLMLDITINPWPTEKEKEVA